MFVIGFQEIVALTAQQIVQTDPEKRYGYLLGLNIFGLTCFSILQAHMGKQDHGDP